MLVLRHLRSPFLSLTLAALGAAGAGLAAAESGIEPLALPGTSHALIEVAPLRACVPRDQAEALRPLVARAAQLYRHLAHDAGVEPSRLTLVLDDALDEHNGFSSVVPDDTVLVLLAPAPPRSGIFDGRDALERTLVHELAHHLSNSRNQGFRGGMAAIFGKVAPTEPLSMLWAYLTVPAHITQPSFWHEGLAQWAETAYADPASPWAGRGRDSLTHLVWRLDADAGAIPGPEGWRPGFQQWPFGNRTYLYGLAYTRWLEAAYGRNRSVWDLVEAQSGEWPFMFDRGAIAPLGVPHAELIARARAALLAEQQAALAAIRSVPLTATRRLTPEDGVVGAPAWLADGRLASAWIDPWGNDRIAYVGADGAIERTGLRVTRGGEVRGQRDGSYVYADSAAAVPAAMPGLDRHCGFAEAAEVLLFTRSRVVLVDAGGQPHLLEGRRLTQPDLRSRGTGWEVAAVRFLPAGGQELVRCTLDDQGQSPWTALATADRAWSPAFRPGAEELAWVETHAGGSRLVLAPLADPARRTVLAEVRGRLLHPAWSPDGSALFVCADHSGVPNAYRVEVARPGLLTAVTNTVGGIVACVPSPDGRELALVEHDRRGPYLARIANDPVAWPGRVPQVALAWPAPVPPAAPAAEARRPTPLPADPPPPAPAAEDYPAVALIRPLYWTPTTRVTERGGYGVAAVAADPLHTQQVVAAAGVGAAEATGVGMVSWLAAPGLVQVQGLGWRDERSYDDRLWDRWGRTYDYAENVAGGEVRLGQGLMGVRRRGFAYLAAGDADHRPVSAAADRYRGLTLWGDRPFSGEDRYAEVVVGYASTTLYPTSYTREDGSRVALSYRYSGFGGDLDGNRLLGVGSYVLSVWPEGGHQLVAGGAVGWSDGPSYLQGRFQVGGSSGLDLPRGYRTTIATGDHLLGWTLAYRLPLLRPWLGLGTTPFALRQLVLEGFCDGAKASSDHPGGDGRWYRSAGGELRINLEIWALHTSPGLGVARQLDGAEDTVAYLTLDFAP